MHFLPYFIASEGFQFPLCRTGIVNRQYARELNTIIFTSQSSPMDTL